MTTPPPVVEGRTIRGASAVLLPMADGTTPDWDALAAHLGRTIEADLVPAVNMDTGFGPYLDDASRERVLALTSSLTVDFIAGVHVDDSPGDPLDIDLAVRRAAQVASSGAVPILFPSFGAAGSDDDGLVELHRRVGAEVDRFLGFELGPMFHPAGTLFTDEVFEAILGIDGAVGLKHSSLRRETEWRRIRSRDRLRPGFALMTGNDLAIDLVVHGVDYLLGLSTFDPGAFAARDAAWSDGDHARFWELNDLLQYLGMFAFRAPVPAYRHDAAMYLHHRGLLADGNTHERSPRRDSSDLPVLADIAERLDTVLGR
jgi:dihydrodipicolinate synthase/N-acetylneuraminate lyase